MTVINDIISTLQDLDVPNSGIRAALKKRGYSAEEIEADMPTATRACFVNDYFEWLGTEARTMDEAKEYVMNEKNSDNVHKYLKMHLNTAALALKIWEAK